MKRLIWFILPVSTLIFPVAVLAQNPGGVSAGLLLWVKANSGVIQTSGQVSQWTNQAPVTMTTQPSTTATSSIILADNNINFNPALTFDGTKSFLGKYTTAPGQPPLIFGVARGKAGSAAQFVANLYSNSPAGSSGLLYDATTGRYWVDASGTECSNTAAALNTVALSRAYYGSAASTNGAYSALNGVTNSACLALPVNASDGNVQLGGRTWDRSGRIFIGDLAEIIYYNANTATALQINQVESYLALKYGLTLGSVSNTQNYTGSDGSTIYWTGNSTYQNDIFGIGTDNGSGLIQNKSNSMNSGSGSGAGQSAKGNVTLTTSSTLPNKSFMVIGNDAGALTEQSTNLPAIAAGSQRVTRTWLVRNTGSIGAVTLDIDITGLTLSGGTTASNYRLMVNQGGSGNFTMGTQTFFSPASITGNIIRFMAINLNDNAVFTLISQAATTLPANLVQFTAQRRDNNVSVNWTTSEESNVDHYEIQTSTNALHFSPSGRVRAYNQSGLNRYVYSLTDSYSPELYIRIKRVDRDGKYSFGPTVLLLSKVIAAVSLKQNPVVGKTLTLNVTTDRHTTLFARVIAADGREVLHHNKQITPGSQIIGFDIGHLKSGVYFLQTQMDSKIEKIRFVKD